jgi:hypothetical protein
MPHVNGIGLRAFQKQVLVVVVGRSLLGVLHGQEGKYSLQYMHEELVFLGWTARTRAKKRKK